MVKGVPPAVQCATHFAQLDKVALRQARDKLQGNALFKNPAILDTLAWSDYRLGDFEKAKGEYLPRCHVGPEQGLCLRRSCSGVFVPI
jgi:hypothetical protein